MQCTRLIQGWEKKDNSRVYWKSFKAMYSLSISLFKSFTLYQAVCLDCRTTACLKTGIFTLWFNWEMQNWTAHNIPSFAHWSVQLARTYLWNHRKEICCLKMHVFNCTQATVLIKDQRRLLKVTATQISTVWFLMLLLKLGTCLYKNLPLPLAVCISSPVKQQPFSPSS